jgi:hypothetical protein
MNEWIINECTDFCCSRHASKQARHASKQVLHTQGKRLLNAELTMVNPDGMVRKLFAVRGTILFPVVETKRAPVAPRTFGGVANAAAPELSKFPVAVPVPEMAASKSAALAPVAALAAVAAPEPSPPAEPN